MNGDAVEDTVENNHEAKSSRNRFFHILELSIPVLTFFLGYGLSYWEKYLDKQDKIDNIEYIMLTELGQNLGYLASIQPPQDAQDAQDGPVAPQLVSVMASRLSLEVFKAYLNQIAELPRDEARPVFDAYISLRDLTEEAKQFLGSDPKANRTIWAARAVSVTSQSEAAYDKVLAAVQELPGGSKTAEEALKKHGESVRKYKLTTQHLQQLQEQEPSEK